LKPLIGNDDPTIIEVVALTLWLPAGS